MRYILVGLLLVPFYLKGQNVGIGTTSPQSELHIKGGILSDSTAGTTPVSGPGTRFMWIPSKRAFRGGSVNAAQWDDINIGSHSFAFGSGAIASGNGAIALGQNSAATGLHTVAIGSGASAYNQSAAIGSLAKALGDFSLALGSQAEATSIYGVSIGSATRAKAAGSVSLGFGVVSQSYAGAVVGQFNDTTNAGSSTTTDPLNRIFQVGNGSILSRSNVMTVLQNGKVGINTITPAALLHLDNGAILATGNTGATPVTGEGSRLMWVPVKSAFRIGTVGADKPLSWNEDSIGINSLAAGFNAVANGNTAIALGGNVAASGFNAVAIGQEARASGNQSTAVGFGTLASGPVSTAMGFSTIASGNSATSFGYLNEAGGSVSLAAGRETKALNYAAFTMGQFAEARGRTASALGYYTKSKHFAGVVLGTFNDSTNSTDPENINQANRLFQIGNGTADNARNNALTVLQNGNIGIKTTTPAALLHVNNGTLLADGTTGATPVSGAGTRLMWIPDKAAFRSGAVGTDRPLSWNTDSIGTYSFATGVNAVASGNASIALGINVAATGYNAIVLGNLSRAAGNESFATGYSNRAAGNQSTAMGIYNLASGPGSMAMGYNTVAGGNVATSMGYFTEARGDLSFVVGEDARATSYAAISMGRSTLASGSISTALGYFSKSKHFSGLVIGTYNDSTNAADPANINNSNRLFQIGNGTADNARRNALTVLQNGNVGIGETSPAVPLNFASNTGPKISLWGVGTGQYGFGIQPSLMQVYTDVQGSDIAFGYGNNAAFTEKVRIKGNGNVGIGQSNPFVPLSFASGIGNKILLYGLAANHYGFGIQDNLLQLYSDGLTSDIAFGYGSSSVFTERMRIKGTGNVEIKSGGLIVSGDVNANGNIQVQNGKAIIRSTGSQQLKKVTTQVPVNAVINNSTSIVANFSFSEAFSAVAECYVGNIVVNTSNGEYMVMNLANITSTGGTLYVYNPRSGAGSSSVNFTVNIIAIGPQ